MRDLHHNEAALVRLLEAAGVTSEQGDGIDSELDSDDLRALWRLVSDDKSGAGFDDFTAAVVQACMAEWPAGSAAPDELALRVGRWRIDLTRAGIRTGLLTSIIAAALVEQGMTEFSIAFVTAVLPTVLDIERVELSPKENMLLADLRLTPAMQAGWASEADLYAALPAAARESVNRYDFADFVQRLKDTGELDESGGGLLRIRPASS